VKLGHQTPWNRRRLVGIFVVRETFLGDVPFSVRIGWLWDDYLAERADARVSGPRGNGPFGGKF